MDPVSGESRLASMQPSLNTSLLNVSQPHKNNSYLSNNMLIMETLSGEKESKSEITEERQ